MMADPTSITLQRGQARLAAMSGDLEGALAGYATLTRRSPTTEYLIEYAQLLRAAGRDTEAQAQLQLATAAHQLFVANGGSDGLTGAALAIATGRPADALREAQAEWEQRHFVDVADTLGWALHLNNRDAEALDYARQAYATGAASPVYAYHLGMIELALGDRTAAKEHLTRALQLNPNFSPLDAPAARTALASLES
jgi:tetratricopeptide (TPR) repeat protein